MKRKTVITQEEIDKMLEEKMEEYRLQHTAWVVLKNGYTYIGFDVCDYITELLMNDLIKLVLLMGQTYSIKYPFGDDKEYYISLTGEDGSRAKFIRNFIANNYKLSW
jgi:hypothetical protein